MIVPRRHLRHWAATLLLLWLFGIGSAVANGCMAGRSPVWGGADHRGDGGVPASQEAMADGDVSQGGMAAGQTPGDHRVAANCQDFCSKVSASPVGLKWGSSAGWDGGDPGAALAPSPAPLAAALGVHDSARAWAPRTAAAPALPVRIAFLRRTL